MISLTDLAKRIDRFVDEQPEFTALILFSCLVSMAAVMQAG
jgi:hypothetical protein